METIIGPIETVSNFIWGGSWNGTQLLPMGPLAILLLGTGLFMMYRVGGRPLRRFVPALVEVWQGRKAQGEDGAITPWQALSTALSGQVGTGNLAGVATAITLGGPGAIFWMWVTALFGMALAFSESSLAVKYRETDEYGRINGGPMYYIKNGLGKKWAWLAVIFCLGTLFSAMVTGSMIQANSITEAAVETGSAVFGLVIPNWLVGVILCGLVFAVIIGGIKSIGSVAGKVVPLMAAAYVIVALIVLIVNAPKVPAAFGEIIGSAFGLREAVGGATGYAVLAAIRAGIARGLFSNEAGQGSAPIAHAAARTKNPVQQGEIAMIGVFIDTIIICTMTALVILTVTGDFKKSGALLAANQCIESGYDLPAGSDLETLFPSAYAEGREQTIADNGAAAAAWLQECQASGVEIDESAIAGASDPTVLMDVDHAWETDANSSAITTRAYGAAFAGGEFIVPIALFFFAFTTIIGWSYYGEQAVTYLVGEWATHPFRYVWVLVVFAGTVLPAGGLWLLGDIANAAMAFPNLIAIIALSGVVVAMHKLNDDPARGHPVVDKTEDPSAD
ncbi:sodium:alanine symporter family protein [Henriciella sp.]|uniref:alanine/glycine:cation symporter family protein n=1 Tax=Henriciella sp. TaxID=1968823 RepID=UPI0026273F99|nr:alanine/glycine:cation symporter family protein [Henriciella sp.]